MKSLDEELDEMDKRNGELERDGSFSYDLDYARLRTIIDDLRKENARLRDDQNHGEHISAEQLKEMIRLDGGQLK